MEIEYVTTFHVAGFKQCPYYHKAATAFSAMQAIYPSSILADLHEFESKDLFKGWLSSQKGFIESLGNRAIGHTSSPFVWKSMNEKLEFIGGCDDSLAYIKKEFMNGGPVVKSEVHHAPEEDDNGNYDYDLIVIGGGSGGLACSKEAVKLGAKVAVLDYVKPSPQGSTWGLGGTCVNVGCIPKKLMHQSSLIGELVRKDAGSFGWKQGSGDITISHDWSVLVQSVQDYIHGLNFKYRVDLRDKNVEYENFLGKFLDSHTIECTNEAKNKPSKKLTAKRFVIAVGGRPSALQCPGGEHAISSDDIFQLERSPGKTLVVGASYVALECAGFLRGIGYDVSILVRSILLRGFDQDMAERIGAYMEAEGIKFHRGCVPKNIEKLKNGQFKVTWSSSGGGDPQTEVFDTVLNATGRYPDFKLLGLDAAGVKIDEKTGKIVTVNEQTNIPNIYAIGDAINGPELTPVAIKAGRMLAQRLFGGSKEAMDYSKICTTVFTPIEYGCCGLSEEDALSKYGSDLEIYHQSFVPLEWSLSHDRSDASYIKILCNKTDNLRVVGFHYLGPNAGEITQGVGIALKMNATFNDFVNTVGIHPTTAETATTLTITKDSGLNAAAGGC